MTKEELQTIVCELVREHSLHDITLAIAYVLNDARGRIGPDKENVNSDARVFLGILGHLSIDALMPGRRRMHISASTIPKINIAFGGDAKPIASIGDKIRAEFSADNTREQAGMPPTNERTQVEHDAIERAIRGIFLRAIKEIAIES